jgi:hypothetical protein
MNKHDVADWLRGSSRCKGRPCPASAGPSPPSLASSVLSASFTARRRFPAASTCHSDQCPTLSLGKHFASVERVWSPQPRARRREACHAAPLRSAADGIAQPAPAQLHCQRLPPRAAGARASQAASPRPWQEADIHCMRRDNSRRSMFVRSRNMLHRAWTMARMPRLHAAGCVYTLTLDARPLFTNTASSRRGTLRPVGGCWFGWQGRACRARTAVTDAPGWPDTCRPGAQVAGGGGGLASSYLHAAPRCTRLMEEGPAEG